MKIVTLIENTAAREGLHAQHGLSLYIETGRHRLLFDTGQNGLFAENARALGVDLAAVDIAILSHGHYDHGGGLARFFELNNRANVYVNRHAFEPHFSGENAQRYIGLAPELAGSGRIVYTNDQCEIDGELSLCTLNGLRPAHAASGQNLFVRRDGAMETDDFRHEQYLTIRQGARRVVISGCSHKGILNIMDWMRPDVLAGGFHFKDLDPDSEQGRCALRAAAKALLDYGADFYTCHCTGERQYAIMKREMGERLNALSGGCEITL